MKNKQKGFTLVELSLVLVIIGLIVGGVLVGRELVEVAKMRAVFKEQNGYKTAMHTFQTKFQNKLPGDMIDAWRFWGTDCGPDAATCNGNGDGQVESRSGSENNEGVMFWKHLELAGLGDGVYSGECTNSSPFSCATEININVPGSSWEASAAWIPDSFSYINNMSGNAFMVYRSDPNLNVYSAQFTGPQVYRFDLKYDNGDPVSGAVNGVHESGLFCHSILPPFVYATDETVRCNLHIDFKY